MSERINAHRFFRNNDASGLSGRGVTLLALDSGLENLKQLPSRLRDSSQILGHPHETPDGSAHAFRIASLACGSFISEQQTGIAQKATVIHGDYRQFFPKDITELARDLVKATGGLDIITMPFSATHHPRLRSDHAESLSDLIHDPEIAALCIAATGHDGPGRLRFPATLPSFLSVGICDEVGRMLPATGTCRSLNKPEILVPDMPYATETENGTQASISGTSAAVAIVGGAVALLAEHLHQQGVPVNPLTLRAGLFALTDAASDAGGRCLLRNSLDFSTKILKVRQFEETFQTGANGIIRFQAGPGARLCISVSHRPESRFWTCQPAEITAEWNEGTRSATRSGNGDLVLDLAANEGVQEIKFRLLEPSTPMAIASSGLSYCEILPPAVASADCSFFLGVSASHNASACVIDDKGIVSAIQQERLTRVKNDGRSVLDCDAHIDYVLSDAGLKGHGEVKIGFNLQSLVPGYVGLSQPVKSPAFKSFDPFADTTVHVSHHLAHAISAYVCSPFLEATVLVADGSGGTTLGGDDLILLGPDFADYAEGDAPCWAPLHVASIYHFTNHSFILKGRLSCPSFNTRAGSSSWGETYAAASQFLFGDWNQGSGKLMGLAAFGNPETFSSSLLKRSERTGFLEFTQRWKSKVVEIQPSPSEAIMAYADFAARIQADLETALIDWVQQAVEITGCRQIAYSGGIALNSSANNHLAEIVGKENFFVLPASNDAGIALGAAGAAFYADKGRFPKLDPAGDYLGHAYASFDYEEAIAPYSSTLSVEHYHPEEVAAALFEGKVVAWFDGGSEFGPRSLGHRSILASPLIPHMSEKLNSDIKFREGFRPFAPVVNEEAADRYFEAGASSDFMLRVVKVKDEAHSLLCGVTHKDGTARVQTLRRTANPKLYKLIEAFEALSGHPVLINTSLNVKGQPIVETPAQAIDFLLGSRVDFLVLGDQCLKPHTLTAVGLHSESVLALAPDVLITVSSQGGNQARASIHASNRYQSYELDVSIARALQGVDGNRTLAEIEHSANLAISLADLPILQALITERFFLIAKHEARAPQQIKPLQPTQAENAREPETLIPGTFRVAELDDTLSQALMRSSLAGITRLSDVTRFDVIGMPVFQAWRPSVMSSQITATQGKGLTEEAAKVSALMEAFERHAANQARDITTLNGNPNMMNGRKVFGPRSFGSAASTLETKEWCSARNFWTEVEALVPASTVFFPYFSGKDGSTPAPPPCTTGLSSGNTFNESVLHGAFEVVERHAISLIELQGRSKRVDIASIDLQERRLVDLITDAGYRVLITDSTAIHGLPTYFVRILPKTWGPPHLITAGQGCALSPKQALCRALLEACQSRIVAILGSREDLARHATDWNAVPDQVDRQFNKIALRTEQNGVVPVPSAPTYTRLSRALTDLRHFLGEAGFHDLLVIDLTVKEVGLPVSRTLIPGMRDVISGR